MQRLMTTGAPSARNRNAGVRTAKFNLKAILLTVGLIASTTLAQAQNGKIGPAAPVTYDNSYEVYGGINFMNFQAGQDLPKRMNLGGAEASFTYWTPVAHLGVTADYRFEGGTTPVKPSPVSYNPARQLVFLNTGMVGATYRGPKNHYAAIDYHALVGVSHGTFDGPASFDVGLYTNRTKPMGAFGGSLDYNYSKNIAVRLSPDLIIEHFGTEYREFFAISGGLIYRFGKR
jgi:hypothetical protein